MLSETEQEDFCMNETMIKMLGFDKVCTKWDRKTNENKIRALEALYNESNDAGVGYLCATSLANLSGLSKYNVSAYMNRLEKQGLIVRDYEYKGAIHKKKYVFTELFYKSAEKAGIKLTKKPRHTIDTSDGFTDKERSELLTKEKPEEIKKILCELKKPNFINDKMKKLLKLSETELKILNMLYKSICIDGNQTQCIYIENIFDKVKRRRSTIYLHLNRLRERGLIICDETSQKYEYKFTDLFYYIAYYTTDKTDNKIPKKDNQRSKELIKSTA